MSSPIDHTGRVFEVLDLAEAFSLDEIAVLLGLSTDAISQMHARAVAAQRNLKP